MFFHSLPPQTLLSELIVIRMVSLISRVFNAEFNSVILISKIQILTHKLKIVPGISTKINRLKLLISPLGTFLYLLARNQDLILPCDLGFRTLFFLVKDYAQHKWLLHKNTPKLGQKKSIYTH